MSHAARIDAAGLEVAELEAAFERLGVERFRARQLHRWIWRRGIDDFAAMSDLSRALRAKLADAFESVSPRVVHRDVSADGTTKFLLELSEARRIESVYIPDTPAQTFCISTQVGCAMRCAFCLTGKMGMIRNLCAGEIAGQVRVLARELDLLGAPFNIVLMGMGEPLHNYDETMKGLRLLADPHGMKVPGFLPYLFEISLLTLPILLYLKSRQGQCWIERLAGWTSARGGIFLFILPLALALMGLPGILQHSGVGLTLSGMPSTLLLVTSFQRMKDSRRDSRDTAGHALLFGSSVFPLASVSC